MPKKPRSNKMDLSKGLWLKTAEGNYIGLSKKALKPENIAPQPIIRYGKQQTDPKRPIELVENASWPVFRESTVNKLVKLFDENGIKPEAIYKDSDLETAAIKFQSLMAASLSLLSTIPLDTYTKGYVDRKENKIESVDVYKYQVKGVNEKTGKEILEEFPYLETTHVIEEMDEHGLTVWPRMYYDMWLPSSFNQLVGKTDADRFALWKIAQKLNEYPFPVKDEQGNLVMDENGDPKIVYDEGMIVKQGYVAQSGSSKQYHALIVPETITVGGEQKFAMIMKLTQTVRKLLDPMPVPKPGEVPVTVTREQKPLVMEGFAQMLKQIAA